ncbi:hypothetical protein WA026_005754 [Henosepilachna vigintioctopunctata]|uniref:Uncharacterized protein n=1 Tax=Henosepilachna vigintioctopunctata TaxID=420089 RepID=A0AAW1U3U2_9CUCU
MEQIVSVFVVTFVCLISLSSCEDTLHEDLERAAAPYVEALQSTKPLIEIIIRDIHWARTSLIGSDPKQLRLAYRVFNQKLTTSRDEAASQGSRNCFQEAKTLLDETTDMFRTDASCLKHKEEEFMQIVFALLKVIFPVAPTASCPIPILCKLNIRQLGLMEIKPAIDSLKGVLEQGKKMLAFALYFPRDLRKCRRDQTKYKKIGSSIMHLSSLCRRIKS